MLLDYTTYADIRAALGVSEEEIDDATMGLDIHLTLLEADLDDLSPELLVTWNALPAPDVRSTPEAKFAAMLKLYSTYAVAFNLLGSAELFGFLKVGDGRASTERVPEAYVSLKTSVTAMYMRLRARLLGALQVLVPGAVVLTATSVSFISAVSIASDPVANA